MINWSVENFMKDIKRERLKEKWKTWYYFTGQVNGHNVRVKGYGTYLQIFEVDGLKINTVMDMKVKDFLD